MLRLTPTAALIALATTIALTVPTSITAWVEEQKITEPAYDMDCIAKHPTISAELWKRLTVEDIPAP
jgi:hypothetical protein